MQTKEPRLRGSFYLPIKRIMFFKKKQTYQIHLIIALIAVGALLIGFGLKDADDEHEVTHYHANYAIFVNGERLDLSSDEHMEDLVNCATDHQITYAEDRAHQHENEDHVAHVHDEGVTWGHFMTNIGLNFGDNYLKTDQGFLKNNDSGTLKFILNGRLHPNPYNQVIQTKDRLLISFGPESKEEMLEVQFPQVASDASDYNERDDVGCGAG